MKCFYFFTFAIGLYFCVGCAEKIDSPVPVANVPSSPWMLKGQEDIVGADLYASCASCHMADGSGRSDGKVPRLAGQSEKILVHKLQKLRNDKVGLPVMVPFARALSDSEVTQVAHYIARLPSPTGGASSNKNYALFCAACHGEAGQGNDILLAPKLCGQHAKYLERRILEIEHNSRGDADSGMISVLNTMDQKTRTGITQWLAAGKCDA